MKNKLICNACKHEYSEDELFCREESCICTCSQHAKKADETFGGKAYKRSWSAN